MNETLPPLPIFFLSSLFASSVQIFLVWSGHTQDVSTVIGVRTPSDFGGRGWWSNCPKKTTQCQKTWLLYKRTQISVKIKTLTILMCNWTVIIILETQWNPEFSNLLGQFDSNCPNFKPTFLSNFPFRPPLVAHNATTYPGLFRALQRLIRKPIGKMYRKQQKKSTETPQNCSKILALRDNYSV